MKKIGIIGHRDLSKKNLYKYQKKILKILLKFKMKYSNVQIITPLADGADRMVIFQAKKIGIEFQTILPMEKSEYKKDFTYISKKEFDYLLSISKNIKILTNKMNCITRNQKYENAGKYISDNCDILLALWDGKYNNLKGGTSETIKYHLKNKKELYYIKVDRNSN